MNELQKLRTVYAELRHHLGREIPAAVILKATIALIRFFESDDSDETFSEGGYARRFECWAVDVAMAQENGWRVLLYEAVKYPEYWLTEEILDIEPSSVSQPDNQMALEVYEWRTTRSTDLVGKLTDDEK